MNATSARRAALLAGGLAFARVGWADPGLAIVGAPPQNSGTGSALIAIFDPTMRSPAPADLRVVPQLGSAHVTAVRPVTGPVSTVLAFDQSGSMKPWWKRSFELAHAYAAALPPDGRHKVEVLTFGLSLRDHGAGQDPASVQALLDAANKQGPVQGVTRLRNFLRDAAGVASTAAPLGGGGARQVIVFTDAGEESSTWTTDDVIATARQLGVRVSVVAFPGKGASAATRLDEMRRLAEQTGGQSIQVDDTDLSAAVAALATSEDQLLWLDLAWCGVPSNKGHAYADELKIELWRGGSVAASTASFPFRQDARGAALSSCDPVLAEAPATVAAPPDAQTPWGLYLLGASGLLGLLGLLGLFASRRGRQNASQPLPVETVPQPAPAAPPAPPAPRETAPEPEAPWQDPYVQLPETHLVVMNGPAALGGRIRLSRSPFVVGAASGADAVVDLPQISGRHASFQLYASGAVFVRDEGSTNGTFVGDRRLSAGERVELAPGGTVSLSRALVLRLDGPAKESHKPRAATIIEPVSASRRSP